MNYLRFVVKRYFFAVLALVFVVLYWVSASSLPSESLVFPKFVTIVTIPLFIWVFVLSLREYRALAKDASVPEKEKWRCSLNLTKPKLVITVATILYVVLIPVVGYCVTTVLYVGGFSFYLGNRDPVRLILYTGIFFAILYAIFGIWLRIRLPGGFLI